MDRNEQDVLKAVAEGFEKHTGRSMPAGGLTGEEMCEFVAEVYHKQTGRTLDPERVWEMSPTGELWPVFEVFYAAALGANLKGLARFEVAG